MINIQDIKLIDIETTSYCNLHCPQCDRFDRSGKENKYMNQEHLDFARVSKNLNLDKLINLQQVLLEGDHGDPVMHPEIEKFIDFFKNVGTVNLVTNGSLRSEKWWESLAKFKNLTVSFSIDGLEDTLATYRINANFDKIIDNARAFIHAGGNAVWKYIIFHHNQHQVDRAYQLSKELGFKKFVTLTSDRNFYDNNDFPVYLDGVYQNRNLKIASMLPPRQDTKTIMIQKLNSLEFQPITCSWAAHGKIYIDYIGNLIPCCMTSGLMWRKDISGQLWQKIVGDQCSINLYHHELSEILESDFYKNRLSKSLQSIKTVHHACVGNCS